MIFERGRHHVCPYQGTAGRETCDCKSSGTVNPGQRQGGKIFYCPFHPFDPGFPELKKGGPACEGLRGIEMDMKADWGTGAWLRGTPGPEIIKELTPHDRGDVVVEGKKTLDAFHSTALDYYLRANEIEYVVFTGFHTDWCVESSARSAYDKGYRVIVIGDCTATDTQEEQDFCENGFSEDWEADGV